MNSNLQTTEKAYYVPDVYVKSISDIYAKHKQQHEMVQLPRTSKLSKRFTWLHVKFSDRRSYSLLLASQIQRAQMIDNALQSLGKPPIQASNECVSDGIW